MTYEEFKVRWETAFNKIMKCDLDAVGAAYYAQEMGELADEYPEYEKRFMRESIA